MGSTAVAPGSRQVEPKARRQSFIRDRFGNPVYEFPGNGSFVGRVSDWQGRVAAMVFSQVDPAYSIDGEKFAEPVADSVYRSFALRMGLTLSAGQSFWLDYDNKGRMISERGRQLAVDGMNDSAYVRYRKYSRVGAPVLDSLIFADGATVTRRFEYNRRGQRTVATDTITIAAGKGSFPTNAERGGRMEYHWNTATARLDSIVATVTRTDSGTVLAGKVRWDYDRGGRDTLQAVLLKRSTAELVEIKRYDAAGRVSFLETSRGGVWFRFNAPMYNRVDDLLAHSAIEPSTGGGPQFALARSYNFTYSPDGVRRLVGSAKSGPGTGSTYDWTYDAFGNRLTENRNIQTDGTCGLSQETATHAATDNALRRRINTGSCAKINRYWSDRTGARLIQLDSTVVGGEYQGAQTLMSYTAKGQLFFSVTPKALVGVYDNNWHWYDAQGLRLITHVKGGQQFLPGDAPSLATGTRTFYVYDGSDVALTVVRSGSSWWVRQRYLTGGVDNVIAGRFSATASATVQNLALISDRQATTLAAMKADGSQESQTASFSRNPFGSLEGASGSGGTTNTETGFTGASTPNPTGGFVYLRNRWYDPQTGRFLTQDPIGLAGGVNLYSYAGNNPVSFVDPFGLQDCSLSSWRKCNVVSYSGGIGGWGVGVQANIGPATAQLHTPGGGLTATATLTMEGWETDTKLEADLGSVEAKIGRGGFEMGASCESGPECSGSVKVSTGAATWTAGCRTGPESAASCSAGASRNGLSVTTSGVGTTVRAAVVKASVRVHPVQAAIGVVGATAEGFQRLGQYVWSKFRPEEKHQ